MRTLKQDLVFTYKNILGLVSESCSELFNVQLINLYHAGHAYKLFQRSSRVDSRKHFLAERIIKRPAC